MSREEKLSQVFAALMDASVSSEDSEYRDEMINLADFVQELRQDPMVRKEPEVRAVTSCGLCPFHREGRLRRSCWEDRTITSDEMDRDLDAFPAHCPLWSDPYVVMMSGE